MKQSLPILSIKIKISREREVGHDLSPRRPPQYHNILAHIYIYMVMLTSDLKVMINNPFKNFFKWIINHCPKGIH